MMKKLLCLIAGIALAVSASAQISHDDILYWVGQGDAHAIVAIQWDNDEVGLAWGVAYDEETYLSVQDALDSIALYDPRFSYQFSIYGGWSIMGFSSLNFTDGDFSLSIGNAETPCVYVEDYLTDASDWDFDAAVEEEDGIILITTSCYQSYSGIEPVSAPEETGEESTFDASDVVYWIGTGSNQAVFVLDFQTGARAWGYRFDQATIGQMIADIDAADPRLFTGYGVSYTEYPVHITMESTRVRANGTAAAYADALVDGMLVKLGNSMQNIWSTEITAATIATVPEEATIEATDVTYWVGQGTDSAVVAITWGVEDTALAWGILFNDSISFTQAISILTTNDSRLTVDDPLAISSIIFTDDDTELRFHTSAAAGNYLQFKIDGNGAAGWDDKIIRNNSFVKVGESAYAQGFDTAWFEYGGVDMGIPMQVVWSTTIYPVAAPVEPITEVPQNSTIAADDILYWIGSGNNQVIFAVDWNDTALAWGFRFSTDTVSVATVMDSIAAADWRFSYTASGSWLTNIVFYDSIDSLYNPIDGNWLSTLGANTEGSWGMATILHNGDFFKWGEYQHSIPIDSVYIEDPTYGNYWNYISVFTTPVHAVSVPAEQGNNGIASVMPVAISAWPNPATDMLRATFEAQPSCNEAALYDINGRKVSSTTLTAGQTSTVIATSALPNGVYMLRIGSGAAKVVVRH